MAPRSAPLVLRQAGRLAGSLSLRDQALAVCTVLVGAGRYPPPPPLFPLLLRQPATAKLSTRTSRTAVTTNRMRLMAHLLVPISISVPENQEHPNYSPHPPSAASSCAPGRYGAAAWTFPRTLRRTRGISPILTGGRAVALCRALCPSSC